MGFHLARIRYVNIIIESDEPPPNAPKSIEMSADSSENGINYKPAQRNNMNRFLRGRCAVVK